MLLEELSNLYVACSGNTCRSPMAQRIFMDELEKRGLSGIHVLSRAAVVKDKNKPGGLISSASELVLNEAYGNDGFSRRHRSRDFTKKELAKADLVITMTDRHKDTLLSHIEAFDDQRQAKVYTLGEIIGRPKLMVPDPVMSDKRVLYDEIMDQDDSIEMQDCYGLSDFDISQLLPAEFIRQVQLEAYLPTFEQMRDMINSACDGGYIKLDHFEKIFAEEMVAGYRSLQRTIEGRKKPKFLELSPEDFIVRPYTNGKYEFTMKYMNLANERIVTQISSTMELISEVLRNNRNIDSDFDKLLDDGDHLHNVTIPMVLCNRYWGLDFSFDEQSLGESVEDIFRRVSPYVSRALENAPFKEAFSIRNNVKDMIKLAKTVCSDEAVTDIYQGILSYR